MSRRLMNRLLKEKLAGRKCFVPFITAGDRGLAFTRKAVLAMAAAGADAIELGVPFSDPIAEGPVIQQSSQRALDRGTTLSQILELVKDIRKQSEIPILLMGYLNTFIRHGVVSMARQASDAGVDGLIIPDLPPDEAEALVTVCRQDDLDTIFLAAPTSTPERLQAVAGASTGYVYYVSVTGTTGMRSQLPRDIRQGVDRVREYTALPILIGFGISTPAQARQISRLADGVIVGSVMVKAMTGPFGDKKALESLTRLCKDMVKAVKKK